MSQGRSNVYKLRDIVNVKDPAYGAKGDGVTNDAAALQAAYDFATTIGATVWHPQGDYFIGATTLVLKNYVHYLGAGRIVGTTLGTRIRYTGANDAVQINNPIDQSNPAYISIEEINFSCSTRTAGKAALADTGSTHMSIKRCAFGGNDYGLVLDQTELAKIDECQFETGASGSAGVWLVNGPERTPGADKYFTNRIEISNCQFNGSSGVGIADDGGFTHSFLNNNYNAMPRNIRACDTTNLMIQGLYCDSPTVTALDFTTTMLGGTAADDCYNTSIRDGYFNSAAAINFITIAAGSMTNLLTENLDFNNGNAGGAPFSGLANVAGQYQGKGNRQRGVGSTAVGNSTVKLTTYTPTFSSSNADAALGNGSINGEYVRSDYSCTAHIRFTVGATTTLGTGNWQFTLPFGPTSALPVLGVWRGTPAGVVRGGTCIANGTTTVTIEENGVGKLGGTSYAWVAGNVVQITMTYPIASTN